MKNLQLQKAENPYKKDKQANQISRTNKAIYIYISCLGTISPNKTRSPRGARMCLPFALPHTDAR